MSKIYLKVKIKSLAEEAKIIRKEERKALATYRRIKNKQGFEEKAEKALNLYNGLRMHRIGIVRAEARAAQLAYGFLNNKKYSELETPSKDSFKSVHGLNIDEVTTTYNSNIASYDYNYIYITKRIGRLIEKYGDRPDITGVYITSAGIRYVKPEILSEWFCS